MADEAADKKIIVDEDWKSQVQSEKEDLEKKKQQQRTQAGEVPQMPEASFAMLITTLATEAMVGLGQVPHPATSKAEVNLDQAKFFIDTLNVLDEKTKGNLTADEKQALDAMLHELQLGYVMTLRGAVGGSESESKENAPKIEIPNT